MKSPRRQRVSAMLALAVSLALVFPGAADAATPAPDAPTPSVTSTPGTDQPAPEQPAPEVTPTPTPTPAPTSSVGTDSAVPTPAPVETAPPAVDAAPWTAVDPSLEAMNEAGNHSMGSTVPHESATAPSVRQRLAIAAAGPPGLPGLDVSAWQPNIDWSQVWANGAKFAYVKATEGVTYTSGQFAQQYNGSAAVGMIRGAYHFAVPNLTSGAAQANYFVDNGGGWRADGKTLPPLLDIEYNPYTARDGTNSCYGLSAAQMVSWIKDFSNTVAGRTGRAAAIYTTTDWWRNCTGNSNQFSTNPLFIARYPASISSGAGTLPTSWSSYTFWQYASSGIFPGDQDVFNGPFSALQLLAAPVNPVYNVELAQPAPGAVRVAGWVFDPDTTSPIDVRVDLNGSGTDHTASNPRPDLASVFGQIGVNHGFDITIPVAGAGAQNVCLSAINQGPGNTVPMGCWTIVVSSGAPGGNVESISSGLGTVTVSGWALDPDTADSIPVHVYIDAVGTALVANGNRADIGAAYAGYGPLHGFAATLPASGGQHNICVYALNVGPGSTSQLACRTVTVPYGSPVGNVEAVSSGLGSVSVSGWALDPDTAASIPVHVYVDSVGTAFVADGDRRDIGGAYVGYGSLHGFAATVPAGPGAHNVCIYALNVGAGSTAQLACRVVTVPSGSPVGNVEYMGSSPGKVTVTGWALDPDTAASIPVHVYVDSVGTAFVADGDRRDIGGAYVGYGSLHGFAATVPAGPGAHNVCIYALNVGAGSTAQLACRVVTVPSGSPGGNVEYMGSTQGKVTVSGWALDPDTSASIPVHVYVDSFGTAFVADLARLDIGAAFTGYGSFHGFSVTVPASPGIHTVCVYALNVGVGSTAQLACRAITVT